MVTKHLKARRKICCASKKKEDYESNIGDETNSDQAIDKYLLQPWKVIKRKLKIIKMFFSFIDIYLFLIL